jgi:DNA-binding GntR family transcriptional regulator
VRSSILDGTLAGGMQLRQEALAQQFGVSRIPVREALGKLEAEGYITQELYKGATVNSQTVEEILEMLDIRIGLETRALKLALPGMTRADFARAEAILRQYDDAARPRQWTDLNLAFHLALYQPSRKPRLVKMIEDMVRGTDRFIRIHISSVVGRDRPQAEHFELLRACRRKDERQALKLLDQHIEHTKEALIRATAD